MATDTFTGSSGDGEVVGASSVYSTARSTSTGSDDTATTASVGQRLVSTTYSVFRGFLVFDTSAIPDNAVISSATLLVTADTDLSVGADFNVQVYRYAWADTLASNREANYDGAYGGAATLEGTLRDTSAGWSSGTQYSLAVDPAGISKTGTTRYALCSSRDVAGTTPTGIELVTWRTANHATPGDRPQLEVVYTVPSAVPNSLALMGAGM